jgi:hypothetical protein
MARIDGVDLEQVKGPIAAVLRAQSAHWGAPLANHLLYARRPSLFRGVRGMWGGLEQSGLLDPRLVAMINRRVAIINRCEF